MIICEGPDGSGKSSLAEWLSHHFHLPIHERASNSKTGPITELFEWAYRDVITMSEQPLSIYDRHPLLSEYIYGTLIRESIRPEFYTPTAHNLVRLMAQESLILLCLPSLKAIQENISEERDMGGVQSYSKEIYHSYQNFKIFWPGRILTYNYETDSLARITSNCGLHIATQYAKRKELL